MYRFKLTYLRPLLCRAYPLISQWPTFKFSGDDAYSVENVEFKHYLSASG